MRPKRRGASLVTPQILPERPSKAEVIVGKEKLTITVALPELDPARFRVTLTRHTLQVRARDPPSQIRFLVPLPEPVDPGEFRAAYRNGILDVVAARAPR